MPRAELVAAALQSRIDAARFDANSPGGWCAAAEFLLRESQPEPAPVGGDDEALLARLEAAAASPESFDASTLYRQSIAAIRALPAPEVPECHGCKHWTVDRLAKDYDKLSQYGICRGMRACGVEIETTGDCSVDFIGTDATFCCKGWEAR